MTSVPDYARVKDMSNTLSEKINGATDEIQIRLGGLRRIICRVQKFTKKLHYTINSQGWICFKKIDRKQLSIGFRSLEDYAKKNNLIPVFIFDKYFSERELPFREDGYLVLDPRTYFRFIKKTSTSREHLAKLFFEPREANEHEIYEKLRATKLSVANIERIHYLEETVDKFEKKLNNNEPENDLRDFLVSNPVLLDPGYFNAKKEEVLDVGRIDIVVKLNRHGLLEDIAVFELKLSDEELEVSHRSNIKKPSTIVSGGLAQVLAYVEEKSAEDREAFVKGYLIVGRRPDGESELKTIKRLNKFLHNVSILTYDDILDRAKKIINIISGKNTETKT